MNGYIVRSMEDVERALTGVKKGDEVELVLLSMKEKDSGLLAETSQVRLTAQ
jgi:hypothetical protein